jgi:hypothetical protein
MADMTMYATVDPNTLEVSSRGISAENGKDRFPFVHEGPPAVDPRTEKAVPGALYFDPATQTVRRTWHVIGLSPKELAERKGLHALKVLAVSDQGMVRALEDAVMVLIAKGLLSLDELPEAAAAKFRERASMRSQLSP